MPQPILSTIFRGRQRHTAAKDRRESKPTPQSPVDDPDTSNDSREGKQGMQRYVERRITPPPPTMESARFVQVVEGRDSKVRSVIFETAPLGASKRPARCEPLKHHPAPQTTHQQNPDPIMIEITPTVFARLRGARETQECIERDFYAPCACMSCSEQLFTIADAEYVVCPICRVVSNLGVNANQGGGVGLGITVGELFDCQAEIIANRHR